MLAEIQHGIISSKHTRYTISLCFGRLFAFYFNTYSSLTSEMAQSEIHWPKIVLFGDSLTQRSFEPRNGLWGALLADRLQRVCDVVARGFSGYNTRMCRMILPRLFTAKNIWDIDAFVICLGANDSSGEKSVTRQHVPLEEYSVNLSFMIEYLKSIGLRKEKILLMTPPPYSHDAYKAYCIEVGRPVPVRNDETVFKYVEACCTVAQECAVDVIDLCSEMIKDENWPRFLIDGLHFSHAGAVKVYTIMWPHIAKRTLSHKMILPAWNEVDPQNPEKDLQ